MVAIPAPAAPGMSQASGTIVPYRLRPAHRPAGLDQDRAPLLEAVQAFQDAGIQPFTVPGHKRGRGISAEVGDVLGYDTFAADIPLAGGADDLQMTRGVLAQAERLAADAFGAQRTFFGVNGSSLSNQVALLAVATAGETVVLARNVHKSMHTALILSGARPVYVQPRYDAALEVAHGVTPDDLAATLDAHPQARAAVVVSPTYYGVAADLPALAAVCHARDVALIVDEAWAAHFPFHPALPPAAMACGADLSITSIHKVLAGLSQASIINLQGPRIAAERVAHWTGLLGTTSPSMLILASIDACRRDMVRRGPTLLSHTLDLAAHARAAIAAMPGLQVLGREVVGRPGAAALDETKLTIDVQGTGLSGYAVDAWLRDHWRLTVELSDQRRVLALLTVADDAGSVDYLLRALSQLSAQAPGARHAPRHPTLTPPALPPEVAMTPRAAITAPACEVPLVRAAGRVAAEMLTPYPPGIPAVVPGERITAPLVAYLQDGLAQGMYVTGAADPSLQTVRVVEG